MAYYCGDCVTWINSLDANRYGEKWCDYDRKYRSATQNIYGCRGFVWARRSIITKVCEILGLDPTALFQSFDEVKEEYLVPLNMKSLIDYNLVGPVIANNLESDANGKTIAQNLLNNYIIPAESYVKLKRYEEAVSIYHEMIRLLAMVYNVNKEDIKYANRMHQLIKIHV